MGIKGLTALLVAHAPKAIKVSPIRRFKDIPKEHEIKTLFGRKVAIDASMSIYQFLIAVRQKDGEMLTNEQGETTSHLMGFFYRTIRIVENGIKPAYVFDGKPPELKSGVLAKRFERREEAKEEGEEAKETGNFLSSMDFIYLLTFAKTGTAEDVDRFSRRTVRVTKEHNEECRKLLRLMGIPVVVAPSEAEAQCAELARGGKVYAAGSEDMDTLTFNTPILYRHLTFSEAKKQPISEITLEKALEGLEMNRDQFIELCILLGCDYLEPIKGIGPKSALKLIREHGNLAAVLEHLREKAAEREEQAEEGKKKKGGIVIPEEWHWEAAKELFQKPDVIPADQIELEWGNPDVDGLVDFLVREKGFNEERVRKGAEKLAKFLNAKQQGRLDSFFTMKPKAAGETSKDKNLKDSKDSKNKKRKRFRLFGRQAAESKNDLLKCWDATKYTLDPSRKIVCEPFILEDNIYNVSLDNILREVITEQIDLEIALKKRLLAGAEARIEWANVLRDLLLEEQTISNISGQSSFHDIAQQVYDNIEDSCHIISSHKSRLLRPLTSGKPPPVVNVPIIEAPRTRKRITLGLTHPPPNNGPILYRDPSTETIVKLTCVDCSRSDFPTIQGFLNHYRLAHSRIFGTHDECIRASGVPIDDNEKEAFRLAGVEIHTGHLISVRSIFEQAVGLQGKAHETMNPNEDLGSVSTHLSRTLGVHALTPTLAPFLGKAVRKKQIHVHDPGSVDIISVDGEESRKKKFRQPWFNRQKEHVAKQLSSDEILSATLQDGALDGPRSSEGPPDNDNEHSRFRVRRRLIVADYSLYLPEGKRPAGFPSHTHRWQLAVYTPSYGHNVTTFLESFSVTCLTQPPIFTRPIVVSGPPFVACSTTNKPFLARLTLCWVGQQNHAFEVDHWVELDSLKLNKPPLGEEQMFDVELDRNTPFRPVQEISDTVPWTGEGDFKEILVKPDYEDTDTSPTTAGTAPIKHPTDEMHLSTLPYKPARSTAGLFSLPMGTRKAIEWSRARAIRQEFENMNKGSPKTSESKTNLSTADVFRLLDSNELYPRPPNLTNPIVGNDEEIVQDSPEIQASAVPRFCAVCGVNLRCHSATIANHYRNIDCQCSTELERRRAPVIHVYTLLTPSTSPFWNSSQINVMYQSRDIISVAHPSLLMFAHRQIESLTLSCFPRLSSNSSVLELGDSPDEVADKLSPFGLLAIVTKFVVRDLVNGGIQIARDMQSRTKAVGTESISQYPPFLLTPNHVLESLVIKDGSQVGRKEAFLKSFSRLGTLLQMDTALSSQNNNTA
ncbi:hypothetical protein Clacol_007540 [Clathrus columnatus]|uniref:Flap endonuclease 1 n=1 Tax=Clathrus columnatus TaxID=1419009 RepID=A0AAV5AKR6_9AGAM|nr:hypothetical protein Clacol_007540 [Clathrus columnatus]